MDDNLTPSDIRSNVSKFTDSGDDKSYGKEIKNEKAAEVFSELFLLKITMFRLCEF